MNLTKRLPDDQAARDRLYAYDLWPESPARWDHAHQGDHPDDNIDFHVDLGCGTPLKKGRIGVDRHAGPGVNIVADLESLVTFSEPEKPGDDAVDPWADGMQAYVRAERLPFSDNSVESMISHHALEHIGEGFMPLMDDCYRVLKPGAPFRIITPLFPSTAAVEDPDHVRYFMEGTFEAFVGRPGKGGHWSEAFSVPYTKARFDLTHKDYTALLPPHKRWTNEDRREIRVTLRAVK